MMRIVKIVHPAEFAQQFIRWDSKKGIRSLELYTNLRRQISDSLEDKPFPPLSKELQKHIYFEFGSIEDHFKYRQAVMEAYPCGHYPVFEGYNHMQYQIRDPKGFAEMLAHIAERDCMPELPFIRK